MRYIDRKILEQSSRAAYVPVGPLFDGKQLRDGKGAVLAQYTIWSPDWNEVYRTEWPNKAELRYEGHERAKSRVRRMLPLPRMPPGNPTVQWFVLTPVPPLPFDHGLTFNIVPLDEEDVFLDYDLPLDEDMPTMLNRDMVDAVVEAGEVEW